MKVASEQMEQYFKNINDEVLRVYEIANKAKAKGYDPEDKVTVPLAKNMAERVTGLISTVAPEIIGTGIVERIEELEKQYGSQDWRVALKIAEEVAKEKFCKFESKKKAIEVGIRIGFAYVTVGVVASPIEGFVEIKFKKRKDNGKEYFCPMYSGPIRSAGGTGASVSALIIDYVRKKLGYAEYDATDKEIKRAYTELCDYHERVTNLQYFPSEEEVSFMMKNLPIQINGDASEKYEVSNYKDLDRIETNRIRNGFCLMIAECLCLKAPKVWKQLNKWGKDFDMDQWFFMKEFVELQKKIKAKGSVKTDVKEKEDKITPDFVYLKDVVAGRPVLSYPLKSGGFRLRYGRARTTGLSSDAIHPATMVILDDFMAIGTQMKTERPGKSTVFSSCDKIDGPIVKLKDGSVVKLQSFEEAKKVNKSVTEILYLGDILVNYGDFLNRAHKLIPPGFVEEWWVLYLENKVKDEDKNLLNDPFNLSFDKSYELSKKYDVPLHPRWIYYWNSITKDDFLKLYEALKTAAYKDGKLILAKFDDNVKRSLELIGLPHKLVSNEFVVVEGDDAKALMCNLGNFEKVPKGDDVLEMVNSLSDVKIKDKCGHFIGGRMGRPEKAKMRKLKSSPHGLFPIGDEGGRLRCFQSALEKGKVVSDFPIFYCEKCNAETIYKVCEICGEKAVKKYYCPKCKSINDDKICKVKDANGEHGECMPYKRTAIDINFYFNKALEKASLKNYPDLIKGIRGTTNNEHIPEHLLKSILRAKHNIHVNKDGTTRYDMIEMSITHFKPKEVGVSVEKIKEIGYTKDCYGEELVSDEQILEIKPQDVILPSCVESPDDTCENVLMSVAKFIDDLLVGLYGLEPYYNVQTKNDLVGKLCVAMSPHTSAGIVCRIVGFSKVQGFLAHPYLHSIMRRDCDGDEAAVMLLMDHLLNFSRLYLPNSRGSTQDAPLVLTSRLIPTEVDDMVFDMDTVWRYNLDFYEAAENWKYPWDVKIEVINDRLNKVEQYEGMGFTHDTTDINEGVRCSSYKIIPSMQDKVLAQMKLAEKIRAVHHDDVARLIIERHFLRDIKGNLRKFSMQSFRCVSCNEIYRRPPLVGKCTNCGGKIIFTIAEGSIKKYLDPAIDLAKKYNLPAYLQQT
ncbi:DNA polymerase II large subunit, partial [Candidatus Woesearchaeota archaeon]